MTRSRAGDCGAVGSLLAGLRAATARRWLVAAVWCWHLVLGFALAIPIYRWLYAATAYRPETDALADRFSLGVLADLLQYNSAPILRILQGGVAGGLIVAVFASPLVMAATLASIRHPSPDRRELGAAAAALYWPFLVVIILGRGVAVAGAGLTAGLAGLVLTPMSESAWEPGFLCALAMQAVLAVLVGVLLLAAVDYALVRLEAGRSRRPLSAWLAGVRDAFARARLTLGLWAIAGGVLALLIGVYVLLGEVISFGGAGVPSIVAPAVAFVVQQAFMLTRTWLRVGLLAAEQDVSDRAHDASRASHPDAGAGSVEDLVSDSPPSGVTEPALDGEPR